MPPIPARPTQPMVAAGAAELVNYLGVRETAARRWAENIFTVMALCVAEDVQIPTPGIRYNWDDTCVKLYLSEWATTLRATPSRLWPQRLKALWPSTTSDFWAYNAAEIVSLPLPPSAAAIDRADKVIEWLLWLTPDARLLVAGRANRVPWQRLATRLGWSERTLRYRHADAVDSITFRLQRTWPRVRPFDQ